MSFDVPNRPPEKAVIVTPSGRVSKVVFGNTPLNMFWTNGTDPDLEDAVHYYAYIGNTTEAFDYLGNTTLTSIPISKQLVSGNTYYLRVDSSDGQIITRGDVYSFKFDPDINAPVITDARIDMNGTPYQIDRFNYNDANIGMIASYTRTYEIEISRYASFNDSMKFRKTLFGNIIPPIDVPTYVGNRGDRLFVRMRIIYENQYMKITTKWSPATIMTVR